jgi:hypothetical protein
MCKSGPGVMPCCMLITHIHCLVFDKVELCGLVVVLDM